MNNTKEKNLRIYLVIQLVLLFSLITPPSKVSLNPQNPSINYLPRSSDPPTPQIIGNFSQTTPYDFFEIHAFLFTIYDANELYYQLFLQNSSIDLGFISSNPYFLQVSPLDLREGQNTISIILWNKTTDSSQLPVYSESFMIILESSSEPSTNILPIILSILAALGGFFLLREILIFTRIRSIKSSNDNNSFLNEPDFFDPQQEFNYLSKFRFYSINKFVFHRQKDAHLEIDQFEDHEIRKLVKRL
ncbi:hypothetical protein [Candidatus Lokiarchaeum ossiferum]|uniref:hypothetical protein n=1 Tax=Candidatus Lokiarchaeum ossiferum TaxID=2951803 RepID=UPI00352BF056